MVTPGKAWNIVLRHARKLPVVEQDLDGSLLHVLAEPIRADRDIPPANRAAMDGYAVRAADIRHVPAVLTVRGECAAGVGTASKIGPGECLRIFTGANIPRGADTVVRLEDTATSDAGDRDAVTILKVVGKGTDILRRGENARKGKLLIPAGTRLSAGTIGLCAATGHARLTVYRLPRVCILTTGQELREAGESVAPHQIRDSNGPMLAAALSAAGFCADVRKRLPDEPDAITQGLRAALDGGDVVITVGGVSVGRYDHVPACIAQAGGSIRFHHVAIRPGKPLLLATTKQGRLIWGLPGNPVSAMVAFHEFVLPSLLMLAGLSATESRTVFRLPLRENVRTKGKVQTYHLARAISDDNGTGVVPVPGTGSADLIALGKADGAFAVPAGVTELRAGALVAFRPWRGTP